MDKIWEELAFEIKNCKKCRLCQTVKNYVVGEGNKNSPVMFIGEGPGADEDEQGRPFVGKAGQLLTKILNSVEFERDNVYITNIVKCRPPGNRLPEDDEIEACYPYLEAQIALVNPKIIVAVGSTTAKKLLCDIVDFSKESITKIRGRFYNWEGGIKVVPIFHPSYLLRNTSVSSGSPKYQTWEDMKKIKEEYDKYIKDEQYQDENFFGEEDDFEDGREFGEEE